MNQDTLVMLIKILPTVFVCLILLLTILTGLRRGRRKSLILFIHYLVALGIGVGVFFFVSTKIYTMNLGSIYSSLGNAMGVDTGGAATLFEFVEAVLRVKMPEYAAIATYAEFEQTVVAVAGIGVNLVFGIVCLLVLPFLLRTIFYLFYALFYSERKHRRHIRDRKEKYKKHRIGGLLVGTLRGVIASTIGVSLISTLYYVAAGGIYHTESMKEEDRILVLDSLGIENYDMNKIYDALKTSRYTGVGALYEKLKISGEPIDYFFFDLMLSSRFNTLKLDEDGKEIYKRLNLRKELGTLTGFAEEVLESNAITVEKASDGKYVVKVDTAKIDDELSESIAKVLKNSVLLSDILPMNVLGTAKAIKAGDIKVDEKIQAYFDDEFISNLGTVDYTADLSQVIKVMINAVELIPTTENGDFDFAKLKDVDYIVNGMNATKVKEVFTNLSEVRLITDVMAPLGVSLYASKVEAQGGDKAELIHNLDLKKVNWKNEIANLGNTYEKLQALDLDIARLTTKGAEPENPGDLVDPMKYLVELSENETFKTNANLLIDTLVGTETEGSYLLGQISLLAVKKMLAKQEVEIDGEKKNFKDVLGDNYTNYSAELLREDMHVVINSCLSALPALTAFKAEQSDNMIATLKGLDVESLRLALVGDDKPDTKSGLFDLNLLANGKADDFMEVLMLKFAGAVASPDDIKAVTDWKVELGALCDTVLAMQGVEGLENVDFSGNFIETFPTLQEAQINSLTFAMKDSKLISSILEKKLIETLDSNENLQLKDEHGTVISWATKEIVWSDTVEGSTTVYGELNKALKAFSVITEKDSSGKPVIDLNDPITGVKNLSDEQIDKMAGSVVVETILDNVISTKLDGSDGGLKVTIPDGLVWKDELKALRDILKTDIMTNPEGGVDTTKISDINNLADLSDEDITTISSSKILMASIADTLRGMSSESLEIVVPDTLTGDDFAGKPGQPGEFGKIIKVLKGAKAGLPTTETALTTDNLVNGIIGMSNHEAIADSTILHLTVSKYLVKLSTPTTETPNPVIAINNGAYEDAASENKVIKKDEITKVLDVVSDLGINDFTTIEAGKVLDKITVDNVSLRQNISESNILNRTIASKIIEMSKTNPDLKLGTYANLDEKTWYPTNSGIVSGATNVNATGTNWEQCELNKLLVAFAELRGNGFDISNVDSSVEIDVTKLVKNLVNPSQSVVDGDILAAVYKSGILQNTITLQVINLEDNGTIKIRHDVAFKDNVLVEEEIRILASAMNTLLPNANDKIENLGAANILNNLEATSDNAFIEQIVTSNILNATAVDKLVQSNSSNLIDFDGLTTESAEWYPTSNEAYKSSELYNLLISVAEIGIGTDPEGNIKFDSQEMLFSLNDAATSTLNEIKLDVIDRSKVMSKTVTKHINDHKGSAFEIRDNAYINNDPTKKVRKEEIKYLVDFLETNSLGLDAAIDTQTIINMVSSKESRYNIVSSNIMNITIVSNLLKNNTGLVVPEALVDANATSWYPDQAYDFAGDELTTWGNNELDKLLVSFSEIGATVQNGKVNIEPNTIIDGLNNNSTIAPTRIKADVVYDSKLIAATLSNKLIGLNVSGIQVVPEQNINGEAIITNNILNKAEFVNFVKAIKAIGIPMNDNLNGEALATTDISALVNANGERTNLDVVLDSAIFHKLISDALIGNDVVSDFYYKNASTKFAVVTVNSANETFVTTTEIKTAVNTLVTGLKVNSIKAISGSKGGFITTLAGMTPGEREKVINSITSSGILSLILSTVIKGLPLADKLYPVDFPTVVNVLGYNKREEKFYTCEKLNETLTTLTSSK